MPSSATRKVVAIAGGGAAGFFAAIAAAESGAEVILLEKGQQLLSKVRISGGGRCNVTHSCFDARELAKRYPRGGRALIGPFTRFGPQETIAWFESRGVRLKTEADGRMFPVTDSSQTIIDCLETAASRAGVRIFSGTGVVRASRREGGGVVLALTKGPALECDAFLWAGGGCKPGAHPAVDLGHTLVPPVPSLFTFHVGVDWVRALAGISVDPATVRVEGTPLKETGPVLLTHAGVSGPAILRLSAWGARILQERNYQFDLHVGWLPETGQDKVLEEIHNRRLTSGAQTVLRSRWHPLPARLWEALVREAGIPDSERWCTLGRDGARRLAALLTDTVLPVRGKSLNKEEFVTCGGIPLPEVNFKTMESRIAPGLFFAGEALDIDGITGGFNFQAAWTTGWIAGRAMAGATSDR